MTQKIDKNIPLPPIYDKSIWARLEIGDSFIAKGNQATYYGNKGKKLGRKFIRRRQPDGSYRIWRTE